MSLPLPKAFPTRWVDFFYLLFNQGGPGFCHFVITNLCNACCRFCKFARDKLKPQDISSVSCEDGILSIGSRLTEDFIHRLKEAGLNDITISIDAPSRKAMGFLVFTRNNADSFKALIEQRGWIRSL